MGNISLGTQSAPLWRWINPDSYRYYQAGLESDLFGDWTLVSVWGGLGTRRGNYRLTGGLSYAEGLRKIRELDAHRQKRGYLRVSTFGNWPAQVARLIRKTLRLRPSKPIRTPNAMELKLVLE